MKFLLNMYLDAGDQATPTGRSHAGVVNDEAVADVLRRSGELVDAQALADPSTIAVVRVRNGVPLITNGPYLWAAYTTGYFVLDCESLERAMELAARHPAAHSTAVEVRPLMTPAGLEM